MKDYKRLTEQYYPCVACKNGKCLEPQHHCEEREECEAYNRLFDLEDKIESGELCDREEVRREAFQEVYKWMVNHSFNKETKILTKAFYELFLVEDEE